MTWWSRLVAELRRIAGGMNAAREDRAMREEMRFHVDMQAAKLREQGVSETEARRRAAIAFGGAGQWMEAARDEYRSRPLEEGLRDARFVLRSLRRTPAFTATVLLTLATGIGAAAAIFTVVYDVAVRPLPYGHPGELVSVSHDMSALSFQNAGLTPGMYYTYRRLARSLDGIALYRTASVNATDPDGAGEPDRLTSAFVSGNFMSLFQVPAAHGRTLSDDDDVKGRSNVIVISDDLWRTRFGGNANVIGKRLFAAGAMREIVGVMPASFRVPEAKTQVWFPLQLDPAAPWLGGFNSRAYGRMKSNITVADVVRDLTATLPRAKELFPLVAPGVGAPRLFEEGRPTPRIMPLRDDMIAEVAPALWVVAAAAGLVILVMCANVANLMLVRAEGRHRELAIRAAMGASRWRIGSQFLIESLVLAGAASALALAAAIIAVRTLLRATPVEIPRLAEVRVDLGTVLFVVIASVVVAVACAVPPALRAIRDARFAGLRDSSRSATTAGAGVRLRSVLVGVQMALALVALVASGLLLRSFDRLRGVKPGFDANGVVTVWVAAPPVRYPQLTDVDGFHSRLLERVNALPGVTAAGIANSLPLSPFGHNRDPLFVEGSRDASTSIPPLQVYAAADAGYFRAMRIPLLAGHMFAPLETQRWNEALVSQETAKRMFGDSTGATVIGKRFQNLPNGPMYTVIGVVGNVRDSSLMLPPSMAVYAPAGATGDSIEGQGTRTVAVVARTTGDVGATTGAIRQIVHEIDPTLPTFDVRPMSAIVSSSMARLAFISVAVGIAAGVTLLLGVIGLYGVIAFIVSLRTRELGLRIALGATPAAVASMVVRRGLVLSAAGAASGAVISIVGARFLRSLLFEITPLDPAALGGAIVVVAGCAVAASWIPARRAARLDPVRALRAE